MKSAFAALILTVGISACGKPAQDAQAIERPAYEATSLDGEQASLASLRGSAVLLNVWATWCAPCRQEIPFLAELHAAEAGNGLRVIGVSIDAAEDRDKVLQFAPELGITYDIWLDPEERIGAVMRYSGVPASMLIDREGVVRWKHAGVIRATTPGFREALRDALSAGAGD
jgi:thiol-disulfide isomerase/thioredoxin